MNRDIADAWADRMRSGRVRQGFNYLRQSGPDGQMLLCAWGVLCELAVEAGVIPEPSLIEDVWFYEGHAVWPPHRVLDWAGIEFDGHSQPRDPALRALARLNDTGASFGLLGDLVHDTFVASGRVLAVAA